MVDITAIKTQLDCRDVVAADLGEGKKVGKWTMYRCPFHLDDKPSLGVTAEGWHCFGACNTGGDVIKYVMKRQFPNLPEKEAFRAAVAFLNGVEHSPAPVQQPRQQLTDAPRLEPPGEIWQSTARAVIERAEEIMWSPQGWAGREYMMRERYLWEQTLHEMHIGFIPGEGCYKVGPNREWSVWAGIQIPWIVDGIVWGIKVRRLVGGQKYMQMSGGNLHGGMYLAGQILDNMPVLITEGEINALTGLQEFGDIICPVSLGCAGGSLSIKWMARLASAPRIYAYFDMDEAGNKARQRLSALGSRVTFVRLPEGVKDLNEFALRSKRHKLLGALYTWAQEVLHGGWLV